MASGDTLLIWTALANEPPASAYATLDTRNGHPVLDFDDATDESAVFSGVLPRHYAGGGITAKIHGSFTSAVADEARIDVAFERVGDGSQDVDADGFATVKSVDITAPGTSGHVEIGSLGFTNGAEIDSIAVGEKFRLKVTRDANHANDDAVGDFEVHCLELLES